ncbi:CASP-like protein 4A3 isoform X1 [Apium graveolens]|uniref:CASP-like protein 4A3 isoform X1 n=1 Tax=Apium graveolens TaxID=4045 RepID=UPI003D796184
MDKQQNFRQQKNSPPPPYDSSISSSSPSSLSHDGEGPEHSLHRSPTPQQESSSSIKHPTKTRRDDELLKKVNLWFRVFGFLFCLISFSIMAADRNKGWTLDSFHRYIEFRYCLTVNVIGFMYSALQGTDLAYQLFSSAGKLHVSASHLRYIIDFAADQILAYLLLSSSSSAATRVEDWKSNWGKDKFPNMANASVAVSFMAFVSLASSSLVSGYTICT